jgi:LuxR family maltose regulon positive regulatory protein
MTERQLAVSVIAPDEPLLERKLARPALPPGAILRPHLAARLDAGRGQPLTLVVGPAGYGKTTLLASWLAATSPGLPARDPRPSAWFSLDEDDGDPVRFFLYLVAAVRAAYPGACERSLALLQADHIGLPRRFADTLVADLAALPGPLALVLDDYHALDSDAVHHELARAIAYMPEGVQLIVASRTDPPWPLGRLRAAGRLAEIRAADLRFSREESRALLAAGGVDLDEGLVAALHERTEGWAAGLQLARISLRAAGSPAAFAAGLRGTDRFIMDYLVDEVFARQPAAVQEFLLVSSVPERFCAALCEALAEGTAQSGAILDYLDRHNLFLAPVDGARDWYRYHPLFRDLLAHRLHARLGQSGVAQLHARAAHWLDARGLADEAARHSALAAGAASALPPARPAARGAGEAAAALLTRREEEILELLAERLTDGEIAERLVISLPTVKKHASNIYGKLGVGNRRQAIARARQLGML